MFPNAFIGKRDQPTDEELTEALGVSRTIWDQLVAKMADTLGVKEQDWTSYSVKAGWALRLRRNGRNIVYLSPCAGCFFASFALGDKAVATARQGDLPPAIIDSINGSRRYAEGTAVRIEVHTAEDVDSVMKLAAIKLAN